MSRRYGLTVVDIQVDLSSMTVRPLFFFSRLARFILPTIILASAVRLVYTNLGQYDPSYDAGVYLESARMMRRGYPLYQVIFDSQPPLWLMLVSLSFHCFGESVLAGQLVTATAGLVTVAATLTAAAQLGGWSGGLIAGVLVMLSPLALKWSRIVTADLPSVAFAAVGMALAARYVPSGRRPWLIAASLATTCSVLVKLPGLYTFPALGLMVTARWRREPALNYRRLARAVAWDSLIISGVFASATLTVMLIMGVGDVWNQVVTFHSAARAAFPSMAIGQKCRLMLGFADGERLLAYAAPFAVLSVLGGLEGLVPLLWAFCTFIGLLSPAAFRTTHGCANPADRDGGRSRLDPILEVEPSLARVVPRGKQPGRFRHWYRRCAWHKCRHPNSSRAIAHCLHRSDCA